MIISRLDALPKIESWLNEPNVSHMSVQYARSFATQLGPLSEKFDWRVLRLSEVESGIITAYHQSDLVSIIVNFKADGECQFHAGLHSGDTLQNTCYLDKGPDDWVAVQATIDIIRMLIR